MLLLSIGLVEGTSDGAVGPVMVLLLGAAGDVCIWVWVPSGLVVVVVVDCVAGISVGDMFAGAVVVTVVCVVCEGTVVSVGAAVVVVVDCVTEGVVPEVSAVVVVVV
jgi:hypothetical protein